MTLTLALGEDTSRDDFLDCDDRANEADGITRRSDKTARVFRK